MPSLPELGDEMFLSDAIAAYVEHVNQLHSKCLQFARRLNKLANRSISRATIDRTNLQQILLATLLLRGISAFQAAIILLERGLPQEGRVALRTLLEILFKTTAIAKDVDIADAFVREDEILRRKLMRKHGALSHAAQDRSLQEELRALLQECEKRIAEGEVKELSTQWFADRAGLLDLYNTAYAILSTDVHVSARTLERSLDVSESGQINRVIYGFSDREMDWHILTASESLILTLRAAFSQCNLPESLVDEIHQTHDDFNALHAERDGRTYSPT